MIVTRAYRHDDRKAFLELYRACLAHYGLAPASLQQEARVLEILDSREHVRCLLAFDGDRALGFATWVLTLPAGPGLALYMKELFVLSDARGRGVGKALLAALVRMAQSEGCLRMDWQTDGPNQAAQRFYNHLGAPVHDKRSYRVEASDYDCFLHQLNGR